MKKLRPILYGMAFGIVCIVGVLVFVKIFKFIPDLISGANIATVQPYSEKYYDAYSAIGVLVKDETVYDISGESSFEGKIGEGERIKAGLYLQKAIKDDGEYKVQKTIELIDKKIDEIKGLNKNKVLNSGNDEAYIRKIQININQKKYYNISSSDEDEKNNEEERKLATLSLEELEAKKESLIKEINKENKQDRQKSKAGLVSYSIDGYEEKYNIKNLDNISYTDIIKDSKAYSSMNEENTREFKIVDNFEMHLLAAFEKKPSNDIKIGDLKQLRWINNNIIFYGRVKRISDNSDGFLVDFLIRDKLDSIYKERFSDVDLIFSSHDAFKIPKGSVIEKGGYKGVLIRDIDGIIRFRRVYILGYDTGNAYVQRGDYDGKITIEDKIYKTLRPYDEIILKPESVREGDII